MRIHLLTILSIFCIHACWSQNFLNGDLNGTVGISVAPTNWAQVPDTDPISQASAAVSATSDVTSSTGPVAGNIVVNPYSGGTCVTGLNLDNGSYIYHEGIQQTVAGFTIGNQYRISFWQTVSKQSNVTESTGCWIVYANSTLIGQSAPTTSALPYGSTSRVWEKRYMTFTATAASLTIKFLPIDDDANILNAEGVRMAIDSIELDPFTPLPIELINFNATDKNGEVEIGWSTASEINNDYFTLERSKDGIHFEEIKRVPGAGNSNSLLHYTSTDQPGTGVWYYKLKQTDYDGMYQYSEVVVVNVETEVDISIYPNPVMINSSIQVMGECSDDATASILNSHGFTVKTLFGLNNGIDLTGLPAGVYFLQTTIQQRVVTRRFIIQ